MLWHLHVRLPVRALRLGIPCFPFPFLQVLVHHDGVAQVVFVLSYSRINQAEHLEVEGPGQRRINLPCKCNCINKPYYIYIIIIFFYCFIS